MFFFTDFHLVNTSKTMIVLVFLYKEMDMKKWFARHKDLFLIILSVLVIILSLIILKNKFGF